MSGGLRWVLYSAYAFFFLFLFFHYFYVVGMHECSTQERSLRGKSNSCATLFSLLFLKWTIAFDFNLAELDFTLCLVLAEILFNNSMKN